MTGAVAGVLLMAGGLQALQTLCILAAFPFMFVMVGAAVSLVKELRDEEEPSSRPSPVGIVPIPDALEDVDRPGTNGTPETVPTPLS
jgi:choline-glycine betaine transporter